MTNRKRFALLAIAAMLLSALPMAGPAGADITDIPEADPAHSGRDHQPIPRPWIWSPDRVAAR